MGGRWGGGVAAGATLVLALTVVPLAHASPAHRTPDTGVAPASACTNRHVLSRWGLRRLAAQTVVVPVDENHVGLAAEEVAAGAGGVILFGSRAPDDLGSQLGHLRAEARAGIAPLVMTDEEGGAVQRMANLVGSVPSARRMGTEMSPAQIRRIARRLGTRMNAVGVGMDLAPVLDLDGRPGPNDQDAIGTRSFSPNRRVAAPAGLAFARGLEAGGVVPVVKHFPGIGSANGNTDLGPAATKPWRQLRSDDLLPFRSAVDAGLPAVMVSNAVVPGLTRLPASLSGRVVHRVLRRTLGFRGLVVPDSLTAGAVADAGFTVTSAAVRGLVVGEDVVLFNASAAQLPTRTHRIIHAVASAVRSGALSRARLESAVGSVLAVKHVDLCSA